MLTLSIHGVEWKVLAWGATDSWMVLVSIFSSVKEASGTKMSVFLFNGSTAEVETDRRGLGLKRKPRPSMSRGRGLWSGSHRKPLNYLSSVWNVSVVILQIQCVGPVTSVSTAVHSVVLLGVLRYSVVLLSVFWFSSSTFSHVACWCFCQSDLQEVLRQFACRAEASRRKVCLQPWVGSSL